MLGEYGLLVFYIDGHTWTNSSNGTEVCRLYNARAAAEDVTNAVLQAGGGESLGESLGGAGKVRAGEATGPINDVPHTMAEIYVSEFNVFEFNVF